jgi:hypothetical protein
LRAKSLIAVAIIVDPAGRHIDNQESKSSRNLRNLAQEGF